jgi:hypothetical protein
VGLGPRARKCLTGRYTNYMLSYVKIRWGASKAAAWVKWRRKGRELREEQPCE